MRKQKINARGRRLLAYFTSTRDLVECWRSYVACEHLYEGQSVWQLAFAARYTGDPSTACHQTTINGVRDVRRRRYENNRSSRYRVHLWNDDRVNLEHAVDITRRT